MTKAREGPRVSRRTGRRREPRGAACRVRGGGCSGFQYQLAFDEQRENDAVFESHGLKLLVDNESLSFVRGAVIDYEESLQAPASRSTTPTSSPPWLRLLVPGCRGGAGRSSLSAGVDLQLEES